MKQTTQNLQNYSVIEDWTCYIYMYAGSTDQATFLKILWSLHKLNYIYIVIIIARKKREIHTV